MGTLSRFSPPSPSPSPAPTCSSCPSSEMRLRLSSVGLHGQFPASGLQETHQVTLPNQQRNETIKNINNKNEKEIKKVSKKTEKVLYVTIKYFVVHTTSIAQLIPAVVTTIEPHELL